MVKRRPLEKAKQPGSSPVSSLFGCVLSRWPTAAAGCGPIEAGIPSVDGTNDASIQRPADEVVSSGYSWVPRCYNEACGKTLLSRNTHIEGAGRNKALARIRPRFPTRTPSMETILLYLCLISISHVLYVSH